MLLDEIGAGPRAHPEVAGQLREVRRLDALIFSGDGEAGFGQRGPGVGKALDEFAFESASTCELR